MSAIAGALNDLGFTVTHHVRNQPSVESLFKPRERCGIYVLHLDNGMFYVGQSQDVTKRYMQHRRRYPNIEQLSFRRVRKDKLELDENEISTIRTLEILGFPLLNIVHTSVTFQSSEFDLLMHPQDQKRWLEDLDWIDMSGERTDNPEQRIKYTAKYQREFLRMPHHRDAIRFLREYVRVAIPTIPQGEMTYWACSCTPERYVYTRVNMNWQEVLTIFVYDDKLRFAFHCALSPLKVGDLLMDLFAKHPALELLETETYDSEGPAPFSIVEILEQFPTHQVSAEHTKRLARELPRLFKRHPGLIIRDHYYEPGGQDQASFIVTGVDAALAMLKDAEIRSAIRLLNLRLMRKGTCVYGRNHCYDLADEVYK